MFTELEKTILLNLLEKTRKTASDGYGVKLHFSKEHSLVYTPVTKADIIKLEKKIKEAGSD